MSLQPLSSALDRFSNRKGFVRQLHATEVVRRANQVLAAWPCQAVSLKSGTLVLAVTTSSARELLQARRRELVETVNAALPRPEVLSVRFRLASPTD